MSVTVKYHPSLDVCQISPEPWCLPDITRTLMSVTVRWAILNNTHFVFVSVWRHACSSLWLCEVRDSYMFRVLLLMCKLYSVPNCEEQTGIYQNTGILILKNIVSVKCEILLAMLSNLHNRTKFYIEFCVFTALKKKTFVWGISYLIKLWHISLSQNALHC